MTTTSYDNLYDCKVVDQDHNKIGSVGQVYLDDQTGLPTWITVKTGLFGTKETFVPLEQAVISEDTIQVPYAEEFVKDAPRVDPDRHLDADEEAQLYQYYGINAVPAADPVYAEPMATADEDMPPAWRDDMGFGAPAQESTFETYSFSSNPEQPATDYTVTENETPTPAVSPESNFARPIYADQAPADEPASEWTSSLTGSAAEDVTPVELEAPATSPADHNGDQDKPFDPYDRVY